jgi:hypothetical protein
MNKTFKCNTVVILTLPDLQFYIIQNKTLLMEQEKALKKKKTYSIYDSTNAWRDNVF